MKSDEKNLKESIETMRQKYTSMSVELNENSKKAD